VDTASKQRSVVCFSHDSSLLMSRVWLMEKMGCRVIPVTSETEFRETLHTYPVGLVVLCQSLTSEECRKADAFSRKHSPEARVLVLFITQQKYVPQGDGVLLDAQCGPATFLSTVRSMLPSLDGLAVDFPANVR
jgi:hypothetical protein